MKQVSDDLFAGFSESSEESVHDEPVVEEKRTANFSRLNYDERENSGNRNRRRSPSPPPQKVNTHRHSLFDEDDQPKKKK